MQRLVRCEVEELSHKMEKRNETFERFMPKADRDDVVDNQLLTHRRPPSVSLSPLQPLFLSSVYTLQKEK
jgi:hypothetical protein